MDNKLIVILGPTASGKSELAVKLAKRFDGEIVSADSRQIYKEMAIATAKPSQKQKAAIHHHLIDIVKPNQEFNVAIYKKMATKTIKDVQRRGKLPILCGGTSFYIQAVIDGMVIPEVKPDWKLRKKLEKKSAKELYRILKKLDRERAKTIEKKNPRRLIRAIEIVLKTKKAVPLLEKKPLAYPVLLLGIKLSEKELKKRISQRVGKMFRTGLEKEAENLVERYGWIPPLKTIGYQEFKDYFERKINKKTLKELIKLHTFQFAKRQMTWFKRNQEIKWVKNYPMAEKLIKEL